MKNLRLEIGEPMKKLKGKDAIVNPQNQYMTKGSGWCNEIYTKAGETLLTNFCQELFPNGMEPRDVKVTPGFKLEIDIIHVYPPKFHFAQDPIEELRQTYQNLFATINEKNYQNILMPSLGIGVHGYNHQDVAEMLMTELKKFLTDKKITITLVLANRDIKKIYQKYL